VSDSESDGESDGDLKGEVKAHVPIASVLEKYVDGIEYFITIRSLQTVTRNSNWSMDQLVAQIVSSISSQLD
jgi:hypothetical protein